MNNLNQQGQQVNRSLPLRIMLFLQIYLISTVLFFILGPVRWPTMNEFWLYAMVISFQFILGIGYFYGMRTRMVIHSGKLNSFYFVIKHFNLICITAVLLNLLYLIRIYLLLPALSIKEIILLGVSNRGLLYQSINKITTSSIDMFGGRELAIAIALCGPITVAVLPLLVVYYKRLNTSSKVFGFIAIGTQILLAISTGRNEGLFSLGIIFLSALILQKRYIRKLSKLDKFKLISSLFIIIILLIQFFSSTMLNRTQGSYSIGLKNIPINTISQHKNELLRKIEATIIYLDIYLTEGYYGMSLASTLPWEPTFGFGYSSYLRDNIEEYLGFDIRSRTFMKRAEIYGWDASANWHTAYTWLANDFHWIGVFIIMFFLGKLIAMVYKDAYANQNPIAIVLFSLLIMFVFFIPANNKVFAQADTFTAFWFCLIVWTITKKS